MKLRKTEATQQKEINREFGDNQSDNILDMIGITKEFLGGRIIANDNVDLSIKRNEIHALIGENGSGKSTLMSILFGIYEPTAGQIFYNDEEIEIETPMTAKKLGIGMVHQHYQLVENMSCIENVLLGQEGGWIVPIKSKLRNRVEQKLNKELKDHKKDSKKFKNDATYRFKELVKKYKFNLDPYTKVQELTIGQKQKLEIIKVLWEDKDLIVFDEPTAALSLQEIEEFMSIIKNFKKEGKTVIFISHKLHEVKSLADRLTILRKGKAIETVPNKNLNVDAISKKMIGELVKLEFKNKSKVTKEKLLEVKGLSTKQEDKSQKLTDINLEIFKGEILGIAGVGDNGQTELLEVISGLRSIESGTIKIGSKDITKFSIKERNKILGHIPEDRHKYGMAQDMNLYDNPVINIIELEKFSKLFVDRPNLSPKNKGMTNDEKIEILKHFIEFEIQDDELINGYYKFIDLIDDLEKLSNKDLEVKLQDKEYSKLFNKLFKKVISKKGNNIIINKESIKSWTNEIINEMDVYGADEPRSIIRNLSGGNQQKFVVGREVKQDYKLLVAGHPTRGLDVKAIKNVYATIIENADHAATILSSYELEELLAVCDRIAIIFNGTINTIIDVKDKNVVSKIGKAMVGIKV